MMYKLVALTFFTFFINITVLCQTDGLNDTIPKTVTISTVYGDLVITGTSGAIFTKAFFELGVYRDKVIEEAEEKEISDDVVYIKFIHSTDCRVVDIQIFKRGQLETYNSYVNSWCVELMKKLDEINNSGFFGEDYTGVCSDNRIPLKLALR